MARVAILIPDMSGGGAERVALALAEDFLAAGHEVDLLLLRARGDLLPLVPAAVRVIDLGASRLRGALFPLIRYLRAEKCAALQVSMWPLTIIAVIAHRLARSPARLVLSEHCALSQQYGERGLIHTLLLRASIALFYPLAAARVAVSRRAADDLADLGRMPREAITAIYNPIPRPPKRLTAAAEVASLWGDGKQKRILTAGALKEVKNQRLLIDAFAQLRRDLPAKLMIIGEGELRADLQAQIKELGLVGDVLMPGFKADAWPYFGSADVFVLSSDYEGFGNVLVEALHCGVPVVSTNCESGPSEILGDGRYGILVPCRDVAALAAGMRAALTQPHDKAALQSRAMALSCSGNSDRYLELMLAS